MNSNWCSQHLDSDELFEKSKDFCEREEAMRHVRSNPVLLSSLTLPEFNCSSQTLACRFIQMNNPQIARRHQTSIPTQAQILYKYWELISPHYPSIAVWGEIAIQRLKGDAKLWWHKEGREGKAWDESRSVLQPICLQQFLDCRINLYEPDQGIIHLLCISGAYSEAWFNHETKQISETCSCGILHAWSVSNNHNANLGN